MRQLSCVISDACLCAVCVVAAYVLHHDQPSFHLLQHRVSSSSQDAAPTSILQLLLPSHLQLTSLSTLVVWGYGCIAAAAGAGVLRFADIVPSLSQPLHSALTHVATCLATPCFALALLYLPSATSTVASAPLSLGLGAGASLPIAPFFTAVLSALLFFPLLLRLLPPRPIALETSAAVVSAVATVTLLLTAAVMLVSPQSSAAHPRAALLVLLVGAAPLLLSTAALSSPGWLLLGAVRLRGADVFHYGFATTAALWLIAFRWLLSAASAAPLHDAPSLDAAMLTFKRSAVL